MNEADLTDLKHLALLAELARPLAHECNNFLNNLLLQLAISERSLPEANRTEWANIRSEAKKMAALFQQWQRQRKPSGDGPTKLELHSLIEEVAEELHAEIPVLVRTVADPVVHMGFKGDMQRLFFLLLRHTLCELKTSGVDDPSLEIQLGRSQDRLLCRLVETGATQPVNLWSDFDDASSSERGTLSLPALACKSLADRLEGRICLTHDSRGRRVLEIEFPVARH